jgi:hypothetical protein
MNNKAFRIAVLAFLAVAGMATMAEAIIGRPLTPMSYAGVARRTTYRAVGDADYAAAATYDNAYAAPYDAYAPSAACVPPAYPSTAYNAYGQAYTVCR